MTLLESLKAMGVKSVGLALDMDAAGWNASARLAASLADSYGLGLLTWNPEHKGLDDCLAAGAPYEILTQDAMADYLESKTAPPPAKGTSPVKGPQLRGGKTLVTTEWPSPPAIIPDLLPAGLSMLAGKSKIGKSFFVLDLCLSVATGTPFLDGAWTPPQGQVVYLALEDTCRTLARRTKAMLAGREEHLDALDENFLHVATNDGLPRFPEGFAWLKARVAEMENCRLVVIDTFQKFRPLEGPADYAADYKLLGDLKSWADSTGIALLLIHHVRKNFADAGDDVFDSVLGSTALLGASDTVLLLTRPRGSDNGKLIASGREVQHVTHCLHFDSGLERWTKVEGKGEDDNGASPGAEGFLRDILADGAPTPAKDVYSAGGVKGFSVDKLKRAKAGLPISVEKVGNAWVWRWMWTVPELEAKVVALSEALDKALASNDFDECSRLKESRDRAQEELDKRRGD